MAKRETKVKKIFTIKINPKWCKGCAICVEFCPKKVLAMEKNKAVVSDAPACIGCGLCEMMCPDFAIEVWEED